MRECLPAAMETKDLDVVLVAAVGSAFDDGVEAGDLAREPTKFVSAKSWMGTSSSSRLREDRIDFGPKQSIIACFKLRDLKPQPTGAYLAVRQSFHSRILPTGSGVSAASK
jgi:hypothetical protein